MLHRFSKLALLLAFFAFFAVQACNCGDNPPPSPPAKIVSFNVAPTSVLAGGTVMMSWTVIDATAVSVIAEPGGTLVNHSADLEGSVGSMPLTENTTFVLTAFSAGGDAMQMRTVTLTAPDDVAIVSFTANPLTVAAGAESTLSYTVTNATMVRIDDQDGNVVLAPTTEQTKSVVVTPVLNTSYVLTAEGRGGPKMASVAITVEPAPTIISFTAAPQAIELGEGSVLAWEVLYASSVVVRDGANVEVANSVDLTGSTTVMPTENTTYTLYARDDAGNETPSTPVTVTVNRAAKIVSFTASPSMIDFGDSSVLSWDVERTASIDILLGNALLTSSMNLIGSFTVTPTQTATYTLVAHNTEGDSTAMTTVTINAIAPRVLRFEATPNPALLGSQSVLEWETIGAVDIEVLDPNNQVLIASQQANGSVAVAVTATAAIYTLSATNPNGNTRSTVILLGQNLPDITRFEVVPLTFAGSSTTVSLVWESTGTTTRLEVNGIPDPMFPATPNGTYSFTINGRADLVLFADNAVGTARETFHVEQLATETEPNNDPLTALPLPGDGGGAAGTIEPAGDVDWYSVVVPQDGNIRAEVSDGQGGCAFNSVLTLYGPDGTTVLVSDDDDGVGSCSLIDPRIDAPAANLNAGTYYLEVRGATAQTTGAYAILIQVAPAGCGNQILERGAGEQCDDGAIVSGDGCDAACQIESVGVIQGPGGESTFTGTIDFVGKEQWFEVDMTAEGYIYAETFLPVPGRCDNLAGGNSTDVFLELYDGNFSVLGSDDNDGIGSCALINPVFDAFAHVVAGTYWLRMIEDGNNGTLGPYTIDIRTIDVGCPNGIIESGETCDDNNTLNGDGCNALCQFEGTLEVEPNGTFTTATALPGSTIASGSITPAGDIDFYAITVPAGAHLDAYLTVNSFDSCPTDPTGRLQLLGTNGTTILATNSDGGPNNNCGRIWPYTTPAAAGMAAGTYFIRVNESGDNAEISSYFLHVNILMPGCGNTIIEAATESCDDGNTVSGDGCSSTCGFEPFASVTLPNSATTTIAGSIVPSFARNAIQLNVTSETYLRAETFEPTASGHTCNSDFRLVLFASDGITELGTDDDDGINACALIHPQRDAFAHLLPGSYWLVVEEDGHDRSINAYEVIVRGTSPNACGNFFIETAIGETCDDGGTLSGDGCDASCHLEPDGVISAPPAEQTFSLAITPVGDIDVIELELLQPSIIFAETGIPTIGACTGGDTVVRLLSSTLNQLTSNDDFNSTACSRIDGLVTPAARVPAGTYFLTIEDFANDGTISAYQVHVRVAAQDVCGNGLQEPSNNELCDDGNTVNGDGCSASCALETMATFNAAPGATQTFTSALDPMSEFESIRIDVPSTIYLSAESFVPAVGSCTGGADPIMRLYTASGVLLGSDDDDGLSACALINRTLDPFARLSAGTYYLTIEEDGRNAIIGPYQLTLSSAAADVCGDSIVEGPAGEQCDDGNLLPLDGCSSTCQLEISAAYTLPGAQIVRSDAINLAAGDAYQLDVVSTSFVRIETYAPAAPDCLAPNDTVIRLIDSALNTLGTDDNDGRLLCSLFNPNVAADLAATRLSPGTYYLSIEENGRNAIINPYELRVTSWPADACGNGVFEAARAEHCDDGNTTSGDGCSATCAVDVTTAETEPNETSATANAALIAGAGYTTMSGTISPIGDLDFFQIVVPPGPILVLRARTYSTAGDPLSVCSGTIDTRLQLIASNGTSVLEDNDDINGASNRCSFIDGTLPDLDPNARLLPGTYFLRVSHFNNTQATLPYLLEIQLQPL